MCDFGLSAMAMTTLVMTAVSLAATAASTTIGVISSVQQGKAAQAQADYQAKVAERNQRIAQNNAAMERQTGLEEARRQRMKTMQAISSQQAGLAANGVDIGSNTALDIVEDTAMLGELDALTIQHNAEKNARNYDTQANNFYNDAVLSRYAGANQRQAANMNALSTGIQGFGKMASTVAGATGGFEKTNLFKGKFSGGLSTDNALGGTAFA